MNLQKGLVLFFGTVFIVGIVTYQWRNRRLAPPPAAPAAATTAPVINTPPGAAEPGQPQPVDSSIAQPPVAAVPVNVPAAGWGRNPFLTSVEIAAFNAPPEPDAKPEAVVEKTPEPPPVELPEYQVSAIISNRQGSWAVIDAQVFRVGDRIGIETVRQIRTEAVVLEHDGKTREVRLTQPAANRPAPKGE